MSQQSDSGKYDVAGDGDVRNLAFAAYYEEELERESLSLYAKSGLSVTIIERVSCSDASRQSGASVASSQSAKTNSSAASSLHTIQEQEGNDNL